jgi:hypothetical protein
MFDYRREYITYYHGQEARAREFDIREEGSTKP